MPIRKQTIGIKESFNIVGKSSNPMAPLSEAVMNSLDSIEKEKQKVIVSILKSAFHYFSGL